MFLVNLLGLLLGHGCFTDPYTLSLDLPLLIWFTNRQQLSSSRQFLFSLWPLNFFSFNWPPLVELGMLCSHCRTHSMSGSVIQSRGLVSQQTWLIGWSADRQEPGWEILAVHLLLNWPAWLCLKVIQESWQRIRATAGGPRFDVVKREVCFY